MVSRPDAPGLPDGYVLCAADRRNPRAHRVGVSCVACDASKRSKKGGREPRSVKPRTNTAKTPWSAARATVCLSGHNHPSKVEARVCKRLSAECEADGTTLFRNVRLPLLSLGPQDTGTPLYITIDFGIVAGGKLSRLIDAKPKRRKSRDWLRGKRACESAWGLKVEEVDR